MYLNASNEHVAWSKKSLFVGIARNLEENSFAGAWLSLCFLDSVPEARIQVQV